MSRTDGTYPDADLPEFIPEFIPFKPIPRLFREIVITEKIDGTNALVHVLEDGRVLAGSKNRYLTREHDNYGFCAWVEDNAEMLKRLGPGRHHGEWYGKGVQKRYADHMTGKRLALFNTHKFTDNRPDCCDVVPILYRGEDFAEAWASILRFKITGSVLVPGCKDPEGVVIFHPKAGTLFKYTFDGDGHKSANALQKETVQE